MGRFILLNLCWRFGLTGLVLSFGDVEDGVVQGTFVIEVQIPSSLRPPLATGSTGHFLEFASGPRLELLAWNFDRPIDCAHHGMHMVGTAIDGVQANFNIFVAIAFDFNDQMEKVVRAGD